ncbi:hypothetical protein BC829DRAFT_30026 [Chytridium lagenaria]|nr:hypothetical protein BC829DRAFT_30026 [Chytridium lagenaria]
MVIVPSKLIGNDSSSNTDTFTGVTHVHLLLLADGLEVVNVASNVNVGPDGSVISAGVVPQAINLKPAKSSFLWSTLFDATPADAVVAAAKALKQPTSELRDRLRARDGIMTGLHDALSKNVKANADLKYILGNDGAVIKVYEVVVRTNDFYGLVYIDVATKQTVGTIIGFTTLDSAESRMVDQPPSALDESMQEVTEDAEEVVSDEFDEPDLVENTNPRSSKSKLPRTHTVKTQLVFEPTP